MMDLASRHADRVARKVEDALAGGQPLDMSRSGIGEVHPQHADAAGINEATDKAIAHAASAIGAAPARVEPGFATPFQPKVRLSGI